MFRRRYVIGRMLLLQARRRLTKTFILGLFACGFFLLWLWLRIQVPVTDFLAVSSDYKFGSPDVALAPYALQRQRPLATASEDPKKVALGCAVTTRGAQASRYAQQGLTPKILREVMFFKTLLPSFCSTADHGFDFRFYIAFDYDDPILQSRVSQAKFRTLFHEATNKTCPGSSTYSVHMVECQYSRQPAHAQNDAILAGYFGGATYMYRINDDTRMQSVNWTQKFIDALKAFDPPNVGVVGPDTLASIHDEFLTYDFVHKTHIDIFGFHYPRMYGDWYADQWIDGVYKPGHNKRVKDIIHKHTFRMGQRYLEHPSGIELRNFTIQVSRARLQRYIKARKESVIPSRNYVISMSLWGQDKRYTYGAVRNAQIVSVFFPKWQLRIYTLPDAHTNGHYRVPIDILLKLTDLGADIRQVPPRWRYFRPQLWKYAVADDPTVDYFLIRDPDMRMTARDSAAVQQWLDSGKFLHAVRDHPQHDNTTILPNLWGANLRRARTTSHGNIGDFLREIILSPEANLQDKFDAFYQKHQDVHVHDYRWPHVQTTFRRNCSEFLGQRFDERGYPLTIFPGNDPACRLDAVLLGLH